MEISLVVPAAKCQSFLETSLLKMIEFLKANFRESFEILVIPNGHYRSEVQAITLIGTRVAEAHPEVRILPYFGKPGKGAAIRKGVGVAQGRWIFFTDADLPYDLSFIKEGIPLLEQGHGLVTGSRRLKKSRINISFEDLRFVFTRSRLGLVFNCFVRILFPISSLDTQAGIKGMSRDFALKAFSCLKCPTFYFDIELILVAREHQFVKAQLPLLLGVENKDSTISVFKEFFCSIFWLLRIKIAYLFGSYSPKPVGKWEPSVGLVRSTL